MALATTTAVENPTILLLTLGEQWMKSMIDEEFRSGIDILSKRATLKRACTVSGALKYLNQNTPHGVLVTDTGVIARVNRPLLERLASYVRSGGTVVFSFCFSSNISPRDMNTILWRETWDLPWQYGNYHRTTFKLNERALGVDGQVGQLELQYSQKAVHLKGVLPENRWYLTTEDSRIESLVFSATPITDRSQTPVAFVRVGTGYLGYTGDVNQEEGTNQTVFRMFNLGPS